MKILVISIILLLIGCSKNVQIFKDLDFESRCSINTDDCVWKKSWGHENCCAIKSVGENSFLKITGLENNSVGFIEQEKIIPKQDGIRILKFSSMVKTTNVNGKGAGLNIGIYDADNELITNKDMGGSFSLDWKTGSSDWEITNLSIVSPANAHKIKIGAILYGSGEAYFDNYEVNFFDIKTNKNKVESPYITKAIDIVKNNSLVRDSIDFENLKTMVSLIAETADTKLALEYLLGVMREYGDDHSFLMQANEAKSWKENDDPGTTIDFPSVRIEENIGIVVVPPFLSGNEKLMVAYADSLHQGLRRIYSNKLKGWVVDLRQNTGGNMEPMIVGLGPLLDSGKIGSLVDINGKNEYWSYQNGQYYWEKEKGISLDKPFILDNKLPIVVLTSEQTGSSGEVMVISFIGNTKTILMGRPTWGLTTGNGEFELEDGKKLFMASTKMVDRNGVIYSSQIQPDYLVEKDEEIIPTAIKWIKNNQ